MFEITLRMCLTHETVTIEQNMTWHNSLGQGKTILER
jgi:hypothetical protein